MSTLNALGFSVRRKRNNDITTTKQQQQLGKIIDTEPSKGNIATSLAFTSGPILEEEEEKIVLSYNKKAQQQSSIKLKQSSISKYTTKKINNNKSNNQNNKNNKDPKQSSLLQFLSPTPSNNNINNSNNNNNTEFVLPKMAESNNNALVKLNEHHCHKDMVNKKSEEASDEVSICSIRHPITISEVLPLLIDSFGVYDNINNNREDDPLYTSSSSSLLLQVKPNKKILSSSTLNDLENHMIHQDKLYTQGIRRSRRYYQEDDEEEQVEEMDDDDDSDDTNGSDLSLPSAFTKSMSLFPMKKRYCTNSDHNEPATTRNKHHNLFKDLKEDYTQNEHDLYEKRDLRHSLSVDQVSSLLLNIANEFLAFEDNEWAVTYLQ